MPFTTSPRLGYRVVLAFPFAAALLIAAGCNSSKPPQGEVTGKVTYKNAPFTEGQVNFIQPDKGIGAIASIDSTGKYTFPTTLDVGAYVIYISPPQASDEDGPKVGVTAKKTGNSIPKKYRDAATTVLKYTVTDGKQEFPIELKD